MPLKAGRSRKVISENIREFHTGPTYARTAAKFGAARANAQAVAASLSNARKSKRKDTPMKSKSEDGMAGQKGMSPRKAMASGLIKGGGNFGVEPYAQEHGGTMTHPDHTAGTGEMGAMEDGERGTPPAIHHTKGHMPAQAAPRHGPHHPGGHGDWPRGGKV